MRSLLALHARTRGIRVPVHGKTGGLDPRDHPINQALSKFCHPTSLRVQFLLQLARVYLQRSYRVGGARLPQATVTALLAADARTTTK